jgi:hypothetical protein
LDAKNRTEQRVSSGAVRTAQRSILRRNVSARAKIGAPPYSYKRAGPKQPNTTLPYNNVVIARAYTNWTLTLLLNKPNKRALHLIVLKAIYALHNLYASIDTGLLLARLIISPKYLNSHTFFNSCPLHIKLVSIFIYMAFVLPTLI